MVLAIDNSDLHHGDFEKRAVIIFFCLTPTFLFLRFVSRVTSKQLGKDDWAALAAFVFTTCCNIVTLAAFPHGWGRHKKNLHPRDLQICLILHWVFQITYKMSVACNKVSILLLYLRIMPQRLYRLAIFTLLTIVGLFALATTIAGVFQCIPVDKAWNKKKPGHCYNLVNAWYSNAVFSIVTDILILMLPMHMVYKLQRDRREKFLLYSVFGLGIFVTFTSIMRFFALKSAKNPDTTYDITSGFWSVIEINVGVICICLPPLRSLLSRQFAFFNHSRTRITDSPSNPNSKSKYPHDSSSRAPSELVTIGGTGGSRNRERERDLDNRRRRQELGAEISEEDLVFVRDGKEDVEHGPESGDSDRECGMGGGIVKKTEFDFEITERRLDEGASDAESGVEERERQRERERSGRTWERVFPHAS
ncbi:uncharacterized protein RAG0_18092 [Rhynchosporium agropyri]|uniref:Rhodopsin domain-containing protein n=1 Tax=Rhynchosporium agropyri TaxID=914238 RepID=A0A1E1LQF0_9HELO|nr:uncharacterized protein RAG0_18092 [Rhynchosporium agropyri]